MSTPKAGIPSEQDDKKIAFPALEPLSLHDTLEEKTAYLIEQKFLSPSLPEFINQLTSLTESTNPDIQKLAKDAVAGVEKKTTTLYDSQSHYLPLLAAKKLVHKSLAIAIYNTAAAYVKHIKENVKTETERTHKLNDLNKFFSPFFFTYSKNPKKRIFENGSLLPFTDCYQAFKNTLNELNSKDGYAAFAERISNLIEEIDTSTIFRTCEKIKLLRENLNEAAAHCQKELAILYADDKEIDKHLFCTTAKKLDDASPIAFEIDWSAKLLTWNLLANEAPKKQTQLTSLAVKDNATHLFEEQLNKTNKLKASLNDFLILKNPKKFSDYLGFAPLEESPDDFLKKQASYQNYLLALKNLDHILDQNQSVNTARKNAIKFENFSDYDNYVLSDLSAAKKLYDAQQALIIAKDKLIDFANAKIKEEIEKQQKIFQEDLQEAKREIDYIKNRAEKASLDFSDFYKEYKKSIGFISDHINQLTNLEKRVEENKKTKTLEEILIFNKDKYEQFIHIKEDLNKITIPLLQKITEKKVLLSQKEKYIEDRRDEEKESKEFERQKKENAQQKIKGIKKIQTATIESKIIQLKNIIQLCDDYITNHLNKNSKQYDEAAIENLDINHIPSFVGIQHKLAVIQKIKAIASDSINTLETKKVVIAKTENTYPQKDLDMIFRQEENTMQTFLEKPSTRHILCTHRNGEPDLAGQSFLKTLTLLLISALLYIPKTFFQPKSQHFFQSVRNNLRQTPQNENQHTPRPVAAR